MIISYFVRIDCVSPRHLLPKIPIYPMRVITDGKTDGGTRLHFACGPRCVACASRELEIPYSLSLFLFVPLASFQNRQGNPGNPPLVLSRCAFMLVPVIAQRAGKWASRNQELQSSRSLALFK